jgi:protein ImuA
MSLIVTASSSASGAPTAPAAPVAAARRAQALASPGSLHPGVWRAQGAASAGPAGLASGFALLDAELPGGGWPQRALTELLLARPGVGEMRLLAPALARAARSGRGLMLFDPPAQLSAEALQQLGLPPGQCVVVRGRDGVRSPGLRQRLGAADLCWALEQALRSGQVGAVLAWPGAAARPEVLRRLQLAAQAHEGPAFLLRELAVCSRPSPAPLRLLLRCAGPDQLGVQILKRRGPALDRALRIGLPPVLSPRALGRALAPQASPTGSAVSPSPAGPVDAVAVRGAAVAAAAPSV